MAFNVDDLALELCDLCKINTWEPVNATWFVLEKKFARGGRFPPEVRHAVLKKAVTDKLVFLSEDGSQIKRNPEHA